MIVGTYGRGAFVGSGTGGTGAPVLALSTNQLKLDIKPGATGKSNFNISNTGGESLNFSITPSERTMNIHGISGKSFRNELLPSNKLKTNINTKKLLRKDFGNKKSNNTLSKKASEDVLILDDGNDYPDGFIGVGAGSYFYWRNDFNVTKDFNLQKIRWYMKTETETSNAFEIAVDTYNSVLFDTAVYVDSSLSGSWYEFPLPQYILDSLKFHNGDTFVILIGAQNLNYNYPAAYDKNGKVAGNSYYGYYYNTNNGLVFSGWSNLQDNAGFETSAWLIRAVGNSTAGNQNPVAIANVSPNPANVNSDISFDGSSSYDNDGKIVSYLWDFGDGSTSTSAIIKHQYNQAGTYNYSLTVTDNQGAQGNTTGQISVQEQVSSRITIVPESRNIAGGSNQNISVAFDAGGMAQGTYQAQLNIASNGGNSVLPVIIDVSNATGVKAAQNTPAEFELQQNYPNPFNPTTTIQYDIPKAEHVTLKVYDILGNEVETLVNSEQQAGNYSVQFSTSGSTSSGVRGQIASGIYFYRLKAGSFVQTKKMLLLK